MTPPNKQGNPMYSSYTLDNKHRLYQEKPRKVKYVNGTKLVIRMNSTDLEVVDPFYESQLIGYFISLIAIVFSAATTTFIYMTDLAVTRLSTSFELGGMFVFIFVELGLLLMMALFGYILWKMWFKWSHNPIRFNRKNKKVYLFLPDGSALTLPWEEIYFKYEKSLLGYNITGLILNQERDAVLDIFCVGQCIDKEDLLEYWEFIRCYMEEDVVPQLADLVIFCPPIVGRRESACFRLQYLFYMRSRFEWLFLPLTGLLNILNFLGTYPNRLLGKVPHWPQEVVEACQPDADDPIDVSAANNPKKMWSLVFANESIWTWVRRHRRMNRATNQIYDALEKRHGAAYGKRKRVTLADSMGDIEYTPKKEAQRKKKPQK